MVFYDSLMTILPTCTAVPLAQRGAFCILDLEACLVMATKALAAGSPNFVGRAELASRVRGRACHDSVLAKESSCCKGESTVQLYNITCELM